MLKSGKKSSFFIKFLTSYMLILLVPIIIASLLVFSYFVSILKEEIIHNNLNQLSLTKYAVDQQIAQLHSIANRLMLTNRNLQPLTLLREDPLKSWKIVNELQGIPTVHPFVHEAFLYLRGEQQIYSSRSVYSLSSFLTDIYRFENMTVEQLFSTAPGESRSVRQLRDRGTGETYLALAYPYLPYKNEPMAVVLFLVREREVRKFLPEQPDRTMFSYVLDQQHQLLIASEDAARLSLTATTLAMLGSAEENADWPALRLNETDYYLFSTSSEHTGWSYASLVAVDEVMRQVKDVRTNFIYGLILILFIGGLAIYVGMQVNYKPIRQLRAYVASLRAQPAHTRNELESVREAVDYFFHQNRELNVQLRKSETPSRDELLYSLFRGRVETQEAFNEKGEALGLRLDGPWFKVVIIGIHHQASSMPDRTEELARAFEQLLPEGLQGYAQGPFGPDKIIGVLAAADYEAFETLLPQLYEPLKAHFAGNLTLGLGNAYDALVHVPQSYFEASSAYDYRFIIGINRIIHYSDIAVAEGAHQVYPTQALAALFKGLQENRRERVLAAFEPLLALLAQKHTPLFLARRLCYDVLNGVRQTLEASGQAAELVDKAYPDVFALERLETIEVFTALLIQLRTDLAVQLEKQSETGDARDALALMLAYLHRNYDSCNFSIQDMADHFAMAPPNLSQYFKDRTGRTLMDYTTDLRMDKAKKLLRETKQPINAIAEAVGYYNVSSFIRRFKQVTGITPGDFRMRQDDE